MWWLWLIVGAVGGGMAAWLVADWLHAQPAPEPMSETLCTGLLNWLDHLNCDQYQAVCKQLATGPLSEQQMLQGAMIKLWPALGGEPDQA